MHSHKTFTCNCIFDGQTSMCYTKAYNDYTYMLIICRLLTIKSNKKLKKSLNAE